MSSSSSMGNLFQQQQRRRRRQSEREKSSTISSLRDIHQAEQTMTSSRLFLDRGGSSTATTTAASSSSPTTTTRRNNNSSFSSSDRHRGSNNNTTEQGAILSFKDSSSSFGFIQCADRNDDVFFHFSEVKNIRAAADLQQGDPVEFTIGPSKKDSSKVCAYNITKLSTPIIWEYEEFPNERFQGIVEKSCRDSSRYGTIRMLLKPDDNEEQVKADACSGPLIRFEASDYQNVPADSSDDTTTTDSRRRFRRFDSTESASSRPRLFPNDLIEFSLFTERRTNSKLARNIVLLQSEKERQRVLLEEQLMKEATLERGIVTALKDNYGFLRSTKRREEVYFSYSHVVMPDDSDSEEEEGDNNTDNKNKEEEETSEQELTLKEGQEVEFLVLTEPALGGGNNKGRTSARQVKFLPPGSVQFQKVVAEGITGLVTQAPHPADSGHSKTMVGSVHLSKPVEYTNEEDGTTMTVKDALFYAKDAPGGTFTKNTDGSAVGMWVHQGDTVLFDLVRETIDGSFRVWPTKHVWSAAEVSSTDETTEEKGATTTTKPAVRIVALSLAGRAEGTIRAIKEGYGFIHCTERPVDAYFRLFELLPNPIQNDLRLHMGLGASSKNEKLELKVGMEVQFDLSIKGTIAMGGARARKSHGLSERENLKAQRILLLPPGTIEEKKVIARGVRGVVIREDAKQTYSGLIELEETYQPMSFEDRHPLVAKFVKSMLDSLEDTGLSSGPVIFHDIQSAKDDEVVVEMVERLGQGKLTCSHLPVSSQPSLPGRLVVSKAEPSSSTSPQKNDGDENKEQTSETSEQAEKEVEQPSKPEAEAASSKKHHKKKKPQHDKPIKTVHFDKHMLVKEIKEGEDMPPGKGDVVECDVVQSRSSGAFELANIRIIERGEASVSGLAADGAGEKSGVGVVAEIVATRKFGFISVLDENASKREMLFFHLSSVAGGPSGEESSLHGKSRQSNMLRKGDEVKFEVVMGKNGKRSASNIQVLPRGSLKIATTTDKNACKGLVLMEPAHTTLKNTPSRESSSHGSPVKSGDSGSRWQNVDPIDSSRHSQTSSSVKEEGRILLIDDPAGMFATRKIAPVEKDEQVEKEANGDAETAEHANDSANQSPDTDTGEQEPTKTASNTKTLVSAVGSHLSYKLGAIAVFGSGVASVGEKSAGPRRGDLVSFVKAKSGRGAREIRVLEKGAATRVRGRLECISITQNSEKALVSGTAKFHAATEKEEVYEIDLCEVVSCDAAVLKEKESVEGILHDGKIFGVCRTCDLYLESKLGAKHKERPRLNLTVRKELNDRGGQIMAQSMMAKGPDGTNGFKKGWTERSSKYTNFADDEPSSTDQEEESETAAVEATDGEQSQLSEEQADVSEATPV